MMEAVIWIVGAILFLTIAPPSIMWLANGGLPGGTQGGEYR